MYTIEQVFSYRRPTRRELKERATYVNPATITSYLTKNTQVGNGDVETYMSVGLLYHQAQALLYPGSACEKKVGAELAQDTMRLLHERVSATYHMNEVKAYLNKYGDADHRNYLNDFLRAYRNDEYLWGLVLGRWEEYDHWNKTSLRRKSAYGYIKELTSPHLESGTRHEGMEMALCKAFCASENEIRKN